MTKFNTIALAAILAAGLGSTAVAAPIGLAGAGATSKVEVEAATSVFFRRSDEARDDERRLRRERFGDPREDYRRDGTGPSGFDDRKRGSRFIGGADVNRGTLIGNIPGGIGATGR